MSNLPQNITAFNRIAAVLFAELYESFPNPKQLDSNSLGANATPTDSGYEQASDYCDTATHVVTWLAEEGFLRHGTLTYDGTFMGVRLTMKGLSVLGQIPSTVTLGEPSESIAAKLKKAVSKGAESAASDSIKSLLGQVFDIALRYGNPIANSAVLTA